MDEWQRAAELKKDPSRCPRCGAMMEVRTGLEGIKFRQCVSTENHKEPI